MMKPDFLNDLLNEIKPFEHEKEIAGQITGLKSAIESGLKKMKLKAKVIIGGSFAKGTMIKKDRYDVDIFVVFDRKYNTTKISDMLEKALRIAGLRAARLPGSRDYYSVSYKMFKAEIVPVIEIKKAEDALNVTDVSLLHVNYVKNKISKNKRLGDEIRLSKAFCYANNCYGAESYIRGFSGYCLELLTIHYKSFMNFIKNASKWKDKTVIDPEKFYKNKNVMIELNESKLMSPLILVDPVQKNRNAAAALSEEKFNEFVRICREFARNPSKKAFERKVFDENRIIDKAKREKASLYSVEALSEKKKEDISGAKLLKLFNFIKERIGKEGHKLKDSGWVFKEKSAKMFFSVGEIKKTVRPGPFVNMKKHALAFKNKYRNAFVKNNRLYAEIAPKSVSEILNLDKKDLSKMGINGYKFWKMF